VEAALVAAAAAEVVQEAQEVPAAVVEVSLPALVHRDPSAAEPTMAEEQRSHTAPFLLGAGALAFFPGLWLYGAYAYRYDDNNGRRTYYNETSNRNETRPVECLCAQYQQCGCAQTDDQIYLNQVANNQTLSSVKNGTLYINGTLSNDTVAPGTESTGAAGSMGQKLFEATGYWPVIAGVAYTMWFL